MKYKYENEIIEQLKKLKKAQLDEIAKSIGISGDGLMRPINSLEEKKFIKKEIKTSVSYSPTEEGKKYFEGRELLPEFCVYKKLLAGKSIADLSSEEKMFGIKWAKEKNLIKIEAGKIVPLKTDIKLSTNLEDMLASGYNYKDFLKRGFVVEKIKKEIILEITEKGMLAEVSKDKTTNVTSEMLRTQEWKTKSFKEYDFSIPAKNTKIGRIHPLTCAIERIEKIFGEMGFEEMEGNCIESSFWNFDALFQPQDHPARELADTFYLEGEELLPEKELVKKVKQAHENGWGYNWKEKDAKKRVLRTHTTATSARYLYAMKSTPKKYFAVGRVFRNEATDFKHLAEFYQVEGIVAWEKANFPQLLGLLKEFYRKLGFKKIRFMPSYFPYTEPSVEILAYFEEKKQWIELGGAGIFRPEVSIPLTGMYPVLAWGLSLERPLMLSMGIKDIRTFYKNDLKWLEQAKVNL